MSTAHYGQSFIGSTLFGGEGAPSRASVTGIDAVISDRSQSTFNSDRSGDNSFTDTTQEACSPSRAQNNTYPDRTIGG